MTFVLPGHHPNKAKCFKGLVKIICWPFKGDSNCEKRCRDSRIKNRIKR